MTDIAFLHHAAHTACSVTCKITAIDYDKKRVSLSIRALIEPQEAEEAIEEDEVAEEAIAEEAVVEEATEETVVEEAAEETVVEEAAEETAE